MQTVIVDFSGEYKEGDLVLLSHVSRGGGRNTAKLRVEDDMDADAVALALARLINGGTSEWNAGAFQALPDGDCLHVMCSDAAGDVTIEGQIERAEGETVTLLISTL